MNQPLQMGVMYCHQDHRTVARNRYDKRKMEGVSPPPHKVTVYVNQNHPRCPFCGGPLAKEPHYGKKLVPRKNFW